MDDEISAAPPESLADTFGSRLRKTRLERDLKIPELAPLVGVTEGAIRQMESGQTKSASLAVGLRLARVLKVSPEFLAGEDEAATPLHGTGDRQYVRTDELDGLKADLTDLRSRLERISTLIAADGGQGALPRRTLPAAKLRPLRK